jgi:hypothetical protein
MLNADRRIQIGLRTYATEKEPVAKFLGKKNSNVRSPTIFMPAASWAE